MTKIMVKRKDGYIFELSVKGHSGFAKEGEDIVCAGISSLSQTAVLAMEKLEGSCKYTVKDGYMKCSIPDSFNKTQRKNASYILEVICIGLKDIASSYKKYVEVLDEEVR